MASGAESSKINSLHFCTSNSWGGLEVYAGTLMTELAASGVRVIAVCSKDSPLQQYLIERGIQTVTLPSASKISFAAVKFIRMTMRAEGISVFHVHFHRDIWVASMAIRRAPAARLLMSIYMGVGRKKDILHKWVYNRVDAIFTSSKALNNVLPDRYPVPARKIHYLPYGRFLGRYVHRSEARARVRAQFKIRASTVVVGSMVRLDEGKGVMDFLHSFLYLDKAIQKDIVYLVVGEPTRRSSVNDGGSPFESGSEAYYNALVAFVEQNKLTKSIIFTGYQPDTVAYLDAMDVFVFPSRDEMYSLAMLDAMAMSLPVVAARSGGNLLQVREGVNGLMYSTGNSRDLASVLSRCIPDNSLRAELGRAAREFVQQEHAMEAVINRLKEFYVAD